jgi:hypothetical protein
MASSDSSASGCEMTIYIYTHYLLSTATNTLSIGLADAFGAISKVAADKDTMLLFL